MAYKPRIISYYSSSEPGRGEVIEYLVHHVTEMLSLVDKGSKTICYGERLYNNYKELLRRKDKDVLIEYGYDDIVYTAIVFHDTGKALYQHRVKNAMKYKGYVSFAGHEAFSALLLEEIMVKLSSMDPVRHFVEALTPAIFAILYHHHSLVLDKRIKKLEHTIKEIDDKTITSITDMIKNDLEIIKHKNKLIETILDNIEEPIRKTIEKLQHSTSYTVKELDEKLKRTIASGTKENILLKKLMYLTLTTLITLDYEAAKKIRSGTPTTFGEMCEEWLNHYIRQKLKTNTTKNLHIATNQ